MIAEAIPPGVFCADEGVQPFSFLKPETVRRIREEVGEAWLPASEQLARMQAIYGTDYQFVTPEESNRLRAMLPIVNDNPFMYEPGLIEFLAKHDWGQVERWYEHGMELLRQHTRIKRIWEEEGLDTNLVNYMKRNEDG